MSDETRCTPEDVDELYAKLEREAEAHGYDLNPDREFTRELVEGLACNAKRFGYPVCPCRLASGVRGDDLDIICPCDYRDPDLAEHGCCYCSLYVSEAVLEGRGAPHSIPERRPSEDERARPAAPGDSTSRVQPAPAVDAAGHVLLASGTPPQPLAFPVLRCRVCGYLCARQEPPGRCPICGATSDRFERFL